MNLYVKFRCADEDASILVWTTTPWTLISNVALAVHPDLDYVRIRSAEHGVLYLAKERLETLVGEYELLGEMKGRGICSGCVTSDCSIMCRSTGTRSTSLRAIS
jgi:isoleucyl-tRNA synthetase